MKNICCVFIFLLPLMGCIQKTSDTIPPVFVENLTVEKLEGDFERVKNRIQQQDTSKHLLAEYLEDQQEIVDRLIAAIKEDEADTDSLMAHEIPLQKEECAQLISSLNQEIELIRLNASFKKEGYHILNVKDYGAKGDGITNDRESIRKCFEKVSELGDAVKVIFPEGVYSMDMNETENPAGHLVLQSLNNLIIEGKGDVTLLMKTYRTGIRVEDCYNVQVKNITIDYDPLPFTQGYITNVDRINDRVNIDIMEGFPLPDNEKFKKAAFLRGTMNHPGTGRLFREGDWRVKDLTQTGDRTFNFGVLTNHGFEEQGLTASLKEGHIFVMHARATPNGGPAIYLYGSSYVTFHKVNVYASPIHIAILFYSDALKFIECNAMPKPGTKRLTCANADGFHCRSNRKGPYIKDCHFFRINDDDTNIFGKMFSLAKVVSPTRMILNASPGDNITGDKVSTPIYQQGELLGFVNPNQGLEIDAYARVKDTWLGEWHGKNWLMLELDRPVKGLVSRDSLGKKPFGSREYVNGKHSNIEHFVANLNTKGNGFVIKNNTFGDHRAASIKIQSTNGIIEGNRIEHVKGAGFFFCALMNWLELYPPRNIVIRGNYIDNHRGFTSTIALPTGERTANMRPMRRLIIEDNEFRNATDLGISLVNAENVIIRNNIIESNKPFIFENCKNIVQQNNKIIRNE